MTDTSADTTARARGHRRLMLAAAGAVVTLALAGGLAVFLLGCGGDPLDVTDPAGASACTKLGEWLSGDMIDPQTGKPASKLIASMTIADLAKDSTKPSIRAAAGGNLMEDPTIAPLKAYGAPAEFRLANLQALHAARVTAGVNMPAYAEPDAL